MNTPDGPSTFREELRRELLARGEDRTFKTQLRLRVVPRHVLQLLQLQEDQPGNGWIGHPAARTLAAEWEICLALKRDEHILFVPQLVLDELHLSFDDAQQFALDNGSKNRSGNRDADRNYERRRFDKVWVYTSPDGFALAELLVDKRRRQELIPARPLMALLPNRNTLLLAPADDGVALGELCAKADEYLADPDDYGSAAPIVLVEENWIGCKPSTQLDQALRELRHSIRAGIYEKQRPLLQAYLERQGSTEHVAQLLALQNQPGTPPVYIATYKGATALLPEADGLMLVDQRTSDIYSVLWSDILKHDPTCLEATAWSPPRWRIQRYPKLPNSCKQMSMAAGGQEPARKTKFS